MIKRGHRLKLELFCNVCQTNCHVTEFSHCNIYREKELRRCKECVRKTKLIDAKNRKNTFFIQSKLLRPPSK